MLVELYYSDTCHDCHQVRMHLMELAKRQKRDIKFKEINIDYPEGLTRARDLGILSVPTVVVDGEIAIIGRATEEEIAKEIGVKV